MSENDWNITKPDDHTKIGDIPQKIRDVKSSAKVIIAKEHVTPTTDNAGGQHLKGATRVYLSDAVNRLDPEGNSLATADTTDDGRIHVNTSAGNELRVYVATAAGIYTGWEHVRVGQVKAAADLDANAFTIKNLASGTQAGEAIQIAQIDTTPYTGQLKLLTPSTDSKVAVAVLDPPTESVHIIGKKFMDSIVGDSYHLIDVNGTSAKVYTKYLTGDLDADSSTSVAHEVTVGNILSVFVVCYDDNLSQYVANEARMEANSNKAYQVHYDGTNIIISSVGAYLQGNAYRIKIDYTA